MQHPNTKEVVYDPAKPESTVTKDATPLLAPMSRSQTLNGLFNYLIVHHVGGGGGLLSRGDRKRNKSLSREHINKSLSRVAYYIFYILYCIIIIIIIFVPGRVCLQLLSS